MGRLVFWSVFIAFLWLPFSRHRICVYLDRSHFIGCSVAGGASRKEVILHERMCKVWNQFIVLWYRTEFCKCFRENWPPKGSANLTTPVLHWFPKFAVHSCRRESGSLPRCFRDELVLVIDPRDVARSRFSGSKLAGSEERGRVGSSMSCLCFATRNYQQRAAGTPCALAGLPVERGIRRIFMRARNERRFAYWRAAWSGSPSGSRACCSPF